MKILLGLLIAGPVLFVLNILKAAAFKGRHRKYLTRAAIIAVAWGTLLAATLAVNGLD